MGRRALIAAGAAYVVAAAVLFAPWLGKEREVVEATPAHPPLYVRIPVDVRPGAEACVEPVTISSRTERIRFGTLAPEGVSIPVAVSAQAPGYRSTATVRAAGLTVDVLVEPPPRDLEGRICFTNHAERKLPLLGTTDARILGRADPVVDGQRLPTTEIAVTLMRARPASLAGRIGDLFRHADVVGPGFLAPWMLWLLLPLVLVGIPLGALAAAAKAENREQERREEDLQPDDHERGR